MEAQIAHVTKREFSAQDHDADCRSKGDEPEVGFGMAGGGYGAYGYCAECGAILWKTEEHE